ncbi:hypothetical protein MTO96_019803 [Rhipicephalus appendiculatus]
MFDRPVSHDTTTTKHTFGGMTSRVAEGDGARARTAVGWHAGGPVSELVVIVDDAAGCCCSSGQERSFSKTVADAPWVCRLILLQFRSFLPDKLADRTIEHGGDESSVNKLSRPGRRWLAVLRSGAASSGRDRAGEEAQTRGATAEKTPFIGGRPTLSAPALLSRSALRESRHKPSSPAPHTGSLAPPA